MLQLTLPSTATATRMYTRIQRGTDFLIRLIYLTLTMAIVVNIVRSNGLGVMDTARLQMLS